MWLLYQKGYISEPEYVFSETYDKDGNPIWRCECYIEENELLLERMRFKKTIVEDYIYINITFQEEYKKLDKLCKDCFSSVDGVSEYIRQMEKEQYNLRRFITSWEYDYKMLKHIRWVRNQLSHEVGTLQSDICTQEDLDFVTNFYNEIMNCADSLAQMRKLKENERKTQSRKNTTSIMKPTEQNAPINKNNKKSIFSKLFEQIKKIFS